MKIMAHPAQDTDVSSSFTLNDNLLNNNSSTDFYKKEIMDERDEIDLIWMHNSSISVSKKHENQEYMDSYFIDIKSCENIFPWLSKFNKIICSSLGHRSYQLLKHLLSLYTQNILTSINTYCEKTLDMIKLKNHISSTLTFFHLYWNDIKEHVGDSNSYLNKMTVLLGIYIDMELKTFKHTMDSSKIASKLLSTLWIYLSNSEKHIFRVLLKLKLVAKKYSKICDLIFMKSFASFKKNVESLTDIDYVRYLLLLKIWKRIKETVEEKKEVNRMALTILGPCTPKMRDELLKILPKVPTGLENETIWLLHPNVFDLKIACNNFVLFEETMSVEFKDTHLTKISDSNLQSSQNLLCDVQKYFTIYEFKQNDIGNTENNYPFKNEMKDNKGNNQLFPIKKGNKFKKYKKLSKLKPGEVILIDLTEEDDLRMGKKKKKKSQRNLEWLKMVKKKYKMEKQIDEAKCKNQVEIADAHSTENSKNYSHNILLEYLPISDNKVSESTESYALTEQKPVQDNIHNSLNARDHIFNKKNSESKYMFQHTQCDTCTSTTKQTDMQCNKILYLLKLLSAMGQSIKEPKAILSLLGQSRDENMSSEHSFFCRNATNESSEVSTQGKESFSQPKSSIKTIYLSKECQNNTTDVQSIKQELPTNTNYNVMEKGAYCQDESVYVQSDCHLHDLRSINNHSSEVIETMKQNIAHEIHECTGCYKNIEVKPFNYHNNSIFNMIKNEDVTQNTSDNNIDKTSICDKNIMCMLSDLDKCMDVLNRIGEHIMTVHAEKQRLGCLDKMDACSVSTTVSGNQSVESSSDWIQNINSLTNTEKLSRILELYGKKDLLSVCNCQDFHFLNEFHKSTSQSKEYRSYEKNICPENRSATSFIHNHIKSEFEQPIKKENNESFEIIKDNKKISQHKINTLTNNQICDTSFIHDLQKTKESNRNAHWESTLQNFSQKSNMIKSRSVDEFENIDILDSILNGDITIEDEQEIWEDSQSPLMSPINYDNSNSVLNCITEFFSQSEQIHSNETEEKYILSDTENSQTLLPEGSLGTTGILNSLFDFDLTNMDSPSNDYIYSNIQAVNPRLTKKTFEDEIFSTKNLNISKLNFEEIASEKNDLENILSQRDKEFCNNQNHSVDSSVNIIGFGLNTSKEEVLEFPSLLKTTPLFSGQSTILVNSDNISSEEKESFPKCSLSSPTNKFDTNNVIEKSYIFQKRDTVNQIQSFNDIKNRGLPEIYTSNHIPSNASMNCILNQQEDNVQSSHKYTVDLETSPSVMKQSLDSCDLLSSTDLITCNTDTLYTVEQKDESSLKQRNIQEDKQYNWKEKQNHKTKHRTEISAQSRSSKRTLKCKKKIKINKEEKELFSSIAQSNQNELSLRCSQITIINPLNYQGVQDTCELPLSTFHTSYCKTSPKNLCTPTNIHKQLNCASVQQLKCVSQEKQQILLNFQEDPNDIIYKEDHKLENPQCIMEDNITEDSNISVKSHTLENKSCFKLSQKNMKVDTNITKVNFIIDKNTNEDSNNIVKSSAKWSLQNIDIQPSNSTKGQVIATQIQDEDIPLKKRKLTSKFSPTLKKNTVVYSVNQQKMQKKRFVSTKKGMMCTNKRKNIIDIKFMNESMSMISSNR